MLYTRGYMRCNTWYVQLAAPPVGPDGVGVGGVGVGGGAVDGASVAGALVGGLRIASKSLWRCMSRGRSTLIHVNAGADSNGGYINSKPRMRVRP